MASTIVTTAGKPSGIEATAARDSEHEHIQQPQSLQNTDDYQEAANPHKR